MHWSKGDRYYIKSDEGYTVSFCLVMDTPKYHAWSKNKEPLGVFNESEQAQKACEKHSKGATP